MSDKVFRTGALPDPYDPRDHPLYSAREFSSAQQSSANNAASAPTAAPAAAAAGGATSVVKLDDLPPVYDQGDIGSCVANACLAALRFAWKKATKGRYADFEPSRLFSYYYGRAAINPGDMNQDGSWSSENIKFDTGSWNRAVIHSFLMQGVCKEELWPYGNPKSDRTGSHPFINLGEPPNVIEPKDWGTVNFQARPSSHALPKGLQGSRTDLIPRSISYYRIFDPSVTPTIDPATKKPDLQWGLMARPSITILEKTLRDGWPIIFCTRVYDNYSLYYQTTGGVFAKPPADLSTLRDVGGHAILMVGFDSTNRRFLIQNSWGEIYKLDGQKSGCFWMPYEWFEINVHGQAPASDFWVIKYSEPAKK